MTPWNKDKPYALPWGGWKKFDAEQKAKYPIRWFLFDTIPDYFGGVWYRINRRIWEFKHKYIPKHNYSTIRTTLDPKCYWDPDTRMLYACMDMMKEYVDITKETVVWDGDDEHKKAWAELQVIYNWWVNEYPHREEAFEEFPDVDFGKIIGEDSDEHKNDPDVIEWRRVADQHRNLEAEWQEQEIDMLVRLMKVKTFLWYP